MGLHPPSPGRGDTPERGPPHPSPSLPHPSIPSSVTMVTGGWYPLATGPGPRCPGDGGVGDIVQWPPSRPAAGVAGRGGEGRGGYLEGFPPPHRYFWQLLARGGLERDESPGGAAGNEPAAASCLRGGARERVAIGPEAAWLGGHKAVGLGAMGQQGWGSQHIRAGSYSAPGLGGSQCSRAGGSQGSGTGWVRMQQDWGVTTHWGWGSQSSVPGGSQGSRAGGQNTVGPWGSRAEG